MAGFQNVVNTTQAPGVLGDFASTNPFSSVLAGPGALVAPVGGVSVGTFVWIGPAGQVSQSFVSGYQVGFVGRNQQALITTFLASFGILVPSGFMLNAFNGGDFWAQFPAGATPGMNVYADPNTGTPVAGNTLPSSAAATATQGSSSTITTTTGATATTITVTAVSAGILGAGDVVTSANLPTGTTIVSQLTVTAGSGAGLLGTYQVSAAATAAAASTAMTATSTRLNVTAVASGALNVGDSLTTTGTTETIAAQGLQFQGIANVASTTALTVTAATQGTLRVGDSPAAMFGVTGVFASGTTIASQTSGTPGGVGVYVLSAAALITQNGIAITDTNIAGQRGRYTVSVAQTLASGTVTVAGTYQTTGFVVTGSYTAGGNELAKISKSPL